MVIPYFMEEQQGPLVLLSCPEAKWRAHTHDAIQSSLRPMCPIPEPPRGGC